MPILQQQDSYVDFTKIDVSEHSCGFQIIDAITGNFFVLVFSTKTLDADTIAVLDRPDLLWIFTGKNAFTPIGSALWLNQLTQYASPTGNDSADGLGWTTAKKTKYAAARAIVAAGGGKLFFAPGTEIGNPFLLNGKKQGLLMRGDGLEDTIPGWLPAVPITIEGVGNVFNEDSFRLPPGLRYSAQTYLNDFTACFVRLLPTSYPVASSNARTVAAGRGTPFGQRLDNYRLGWDFTSATTTAHSSNSPSPQASRSGSTAATGQTMIHDRRAPTCAHHRPGAKRHHRFQPVRGHGSRASSRAI